MECPHPHCRKLFASKYNLARHVQVTHQRIRQHFCQFCFKAFASKQNRVLHEYRHQRTDTEQLPAGVVPSGEARSLEIPRLSDMVRTSKDPDLRPFAKVVKVYCWPAKRATPAIPELEKHPNQVETTHLPTLPEVEGRTRG